MAYLRNKHADMEIGFDGKRTLYIQIGNVREYYGKLTTNKAEKFLQMLEKWDEAGGNDGE